MLSYDWLKNNVLYVNITKSSDNEYRSYTIGPTNKDDYYRYRFNKKKVEYFNIRLACILYLITKSKVYRENVENDINIEKLILVDTRCKCQFKYVKKIQNKNVHFIHLPFGKNL